MLLNISNPGGNGSTLVCRVGNPRTNARPVDALRARRTTPNLAGWVLGRPPLRLRPCKGWLPWRETCGASADAHFTTRLAACPADSQGTGWRRPRTQPLGWVQAGPGTNRRLGGDGARRPQGCARGPQNYSTNCQLRTLTLEGISVASHYTRGHDPDLVEQAHRESHHGLVENVRGGREDRGDYEIDQDRILPIPG
jgi:hypothetical protein